MTDVTDVLYRLRDMAGSAADVLKVEIEKAQETWKKLDDFANMAEDSAQLVAASDLAPTHSATIPPKSGLKHAPFSAIVHELYLFGPSLGSLRWACREEKCWWEIAGHLGKEVAQENHDKWVADREGRA